MSWLRKLLSKYIGFHVTIRTSDGNFIAFTRFDVEADELHIDWNTKQITRSYTKQETERGEKIGRALARNKHH